jgi:hypothetical protein
MEPLTNFCICTSSILKNVSSNSFSCPLVYIQVILSSSTLVNLLYIASTMRLINPYKLLFYRETLESTNNGSFGVYEVCG